MTSGRCARRRGRATPPTSQPIDRLRRRFAIARVCVVADRGLISAETLAEPEARRLLYILGARALRQKLVRELVLDDPAPFVPLVLSKRGKQVDYEAKAVTLAGRRYIAPSGGGEGCRRSRLDRRRARASAQEGRQDAGRQRRLSPLSEDDQ